MEEGHVAWKDLPCGSPVSANFTNQRETRMSYEAFIDSQKTTESAAMSPINSEVQDMMKEMGFPESPLQVRVKQEVVEDVHVGHIAGVETQTKEQVQNYIKFHAAKVLNFYHERGFITADEFRGIRDAAVLAHSFSPIVEGKAIFDDVKSSIKHLIQSKRFI